MGHILIMLSRNVSFKQKISTKTQKVAGVRIVLSLRHELEGHRVEFSPGSWYSEGLNEASFRRREACGTAFESPDAVLSDGFM